MRRWCAHALFWNVFKPQKNHNYQFLIKKKLKNENDQMANRMMSNEKFWFGNSESI